VIKKEVMNRASFIEKRKKAERDRQKREEEKVKIAEIGSLVSAIQQATAQLTSSANESNTLQRKKDTREWVALMIAGLVAFFAFYQWRTMVRQLDAMMGQQSVMQGQLDEMQQQQRPWGSAEVSIVGPYNGDGSGIHLPVNLTVKNTGASPAVGLAYSAELYIEEKYNLPKDELIRFCNEVVNRPVNADALLTNADITQRWDLNLPKETVEKFAIPVTTPPYGSLLHLHVMVCVAYRSLRTKDVYYTGYIYKVVGDKAVMPYPATIGTDHLRLMAQPQLGAVIIH
jgi:type II secretory pathway pseudopilin PulG